MTAPRTLISADAPGLSEHERLGALPPFDVAVWLTDQGRIEESGPYWERAIREAPDDPVRLYAFGTAMGMVRRWKEAEQALWGAIALGYDTAEAWESLAVCYTRQRMLAEAKQAYEQSVQRSPTVQSLIALGNAYASEGEWSKGILHYERAISQSYRTPMDAGSAAQALLWLGKWRKGWKLYESRRDQAEWRGANREMALLPCRPLWSDGERITHADGSALDARPVIVASEQGQGDGVQFARFLPLLAERVSVWFRCHTALVPMMRGAFAGDGRIRVLDAGDVVGPEDCQGWVPLMSLPYFLGVFPPVPLPSPIKPFGERWTPHGGKFVFVAEQGNASHSYDWARSAPPYTLSRMVKAAGYVPVVAKEGADWRTTVNDLRLCSRVVTVDTGLAHVAASYGIPTDVFVPSVPEWRWGSGRSRSTPWYPSMTLWWREKNDAWAEVGARWTAERGVA